MRASEVQLYFICPSLIRSIMMIPFFFFPCSFFAHKLSIANKIKEHVFNTLVLNMEHYSMLSTFVFAHLNSQVEQLLDVEYIPFLLELPPYICIYF